MEKNSGEFCPASRRENGQVGQQLSAHLVPQFENNLSTKSVKHLEVIRDQVRQANNLVSQMRDFSRESSLDQTVVDLAPMYYSIRGRWVFSW